jgi:aspartate racemase
MNRAKHIGIVACSAEGAALCYTTVCIEAAKTMGHHNHPEVSMHTHSLARYMNCIYADNWQGVADLMLSSAEKLARTGVDFLICPDNTIHNAMPLVRPHSPLPWLHIAEEVAAEAKHRGFGKIGILGTRYLVESDVYPERLTKRGIASERPTKSEREEINRIIFDELVYGNFREDSVRYTLEVIEALKQKGSDAVALACTELPLIVNESNSPLPTLDSTRLLARSALRYALNAVA